MQRPVHPARPAATGHAVIAGALCLSLLVMVPLLAAPAARLVLALL